MSVEMTRKEIDEFLSSQWIGVLSMKDDDGTYGIPIPYYYDGKTMNFAMLIGGKAIKAIMRNTDVCYTVFSTFEDPESSEKRCWKSVISKGKMERVAKKEELIYLLDLMEEHFKKLIEDTKGDTDEAFAQYKKGLLSNPNESNLFKLHIKEISGRKFGM
ncbi:MAG: hypothetical protein A3C43_08875 [Candidatus Schekmanbacteria bacterium RIFCSPHIGHO2_02_FULL_38_11]|nr:MAG: hypothetical protein A3C43_08875 [Candidatus Schekmanbacteria bacterium RIFCSPHIGHO2_02_FULL_38_11]